MSFCGMTPCHIDAEIYHVFGDDVAYAVGVVLYEHAAGFYVAVEALIMGLIISRQVFGLRRGCACCPSRHGNG